MSLDREIDDALMRDGHVEPSPWFRQRVMAAVRAEAALPPLAFPWKRVAAGLTLAIIALAASLVQPASAVPPDALLPATVTLLVVAGWVGSRRGKRPPAHD